MSLIAHKDADRLQKLGSIMNCGVGDERMADPICDHP
jgi:hypothetical protein